MCSAMRSSSMSKVRAAPSRTWKWASEMPKLATRQRCRKIADEQLFYLMSRGLTQEQAMGMVVNGFIETRYPHVADGVCR